MQSDVLDFLQAPVAINPVWLVLGVTVGLFLLLVVVWVATTVYLRMFVKSELGQLEVHLQTLFNRTLDSNYLRRSEVEQLIDSRIAASLHKLADTAS